ncbi:MULTISPECIES: hypothetical protein [Aliarcobacter]|uniref:hypothetical protein n=1 Tax=Aliarcobacter TaxID=2321111 RepID=UPI0010FDB4ED|nr:MULTISPECIES: hypothetical protein [Aliarcobacter]TLT08487.1 hypothetical protein FE243_00935 [Aliarcobacter thereius]
MSNTNADDKLIGFEYQFFYFLLSLLKMQVGDVVGFEVKEDVHIENDGKITFCQLKHTIQTSSQNKPINLTTSDIDLWKTLSLWVNIINKESDKNEFLQNVKFIFVSNKSDNDNNEFLTHFKSFQSDKDINNLKAFLSTYQKEANEKFQNKIKEYNLLSSEEKEKKEKPKEDEKIKYLNNILFLDDALLKVFFSNIEFLLNLNNIREEIKNEIRDGIKIRSNFRIEQVYLQLIGLLKDDFLGKVINRENVQYSREEFAQKVSPIFEKMRSEQIPFISEIQHSTDVKILDRVFAKQLIDIGIENDEIYEYDYNRLLSETNLKELQQSDEITQKDIDDLDKNTIDNWKPIYEEIYLDEDYSSTNAKRILLKIKQIDLNLSGQQISLRAISNGQFIRLSDIPKLGWKYNWKEFAKDE